MTSAPPPLPLNLVAQPSTLLGGSPGQMAMRAQAVLPAFPPLSPQRMSSASLSVAPTTVIHVSRPSSPTHADLRVDVSGGAFPPAPTTAAYPPPLPLGSAPSASAWSDDVAPPSCASPSVRRDESARMAKAMIAYLLEALQTTMFTKKKDALDAYQTYFCSSHPRYSRADALLLMYGSPITPQSTLSSFTATSSFTRIDRGLLAAAGQLSWKSHALRASASKALGLVALLMDSRHNADAGAFHGLMVEADYAVIKLMKLPKHLSQPHPHSSAQGNLHAALRVIDIIKDLRPDLVEQLLNEKDVQTGRAAQPPHPSASNGQSLSVSGPQQPPPLPPPTLQAAQPQQQQQQQQQQQLLLHALSGGGPNSGASTPRAALVDASPRSPQSPPPLPPSGAAHHAAVPGASIFHTAPHPLNLTSADAAQSLFAGADASHLGPALSASASAASSPQARSSKKFGSLQSGLQRAAVASPHAASSHDDWKARLRSHLSGFFQTRMSREELELKGVLKAPRVFGLSLEELALHDEMDEASSVPRVLHACIEHLSTAEQLALPGLFRISGDSREIAELKVRYDVGDCVELSRYSPHSVAGVMKMWLRELPQPLLTFDLYKPLIDSWRSGSRDVRPLLNGLPSLHRRTLAVLLSFLARVSAMSGVNLMTTNNLAICFSPNILRPRVETLESVARDTPIAIQVVRALIDQQEEAGPQSSSSEGSSASASEPVGSPRSSPSHLPLPSPPPPAPAAASAASAASSLAPLTLSSPSERAPSIPSPRRPPPPLPTHAAAAPAQLHVHGRSPSRSVPPQCSSPPPLPPPTPTHHALPPPLPAAEKSREAEEKQQHHDGAGQQHGHAVHARF